MAERWVVTLEPAVETHRPVLAGDGHGVGGIRHHPLRPSGGRGRGPSPAHRRCAGPTGARLAGAERGGGAGPPTRRRRGGARAQPARSSAAPGGGWGGGVGGVTAGALESPTSP